MKEQKFEKIVKYENDFVDSIVLISLFLIGGIIYDIIGIVNNKIDIDTMSINFFAGICLATLIILLFEQLSGRKVYWRKIQ